MLACPGLLLSEVDFAEIVDRALERKYPGRSTTDDDRGACRVAWDRPRLALAAMLTRKRLRALTGDAG